MSGLDLTAWAGVDALVERAGSHVPDYCEAAIARTARVRQRPAWTFPWRWVTADVGRPAARWAVVGTMLMLALLAGMLLWAGARHTDGPPSLPRNGLLAVTVCSSSLGATAFVLVDPDAGDPTRAPETPAAAAERPGLLLGFSPNGTRIAYLARGDVPQGSFCMLPETGRVWVSAPDGGGAVPVTEELSRITGASWSPDGRRLAVSFSMGPGGRRTIGLANTDGSGMRALDLGGEAYGATWQPGTDRLLVAGLLERTRGLYTVAADGPADVQLVKRLALGIPNEIAAEAVWSPDGKSVAYVRLVDAGQTKTVLHVVAADGTGDRVLPVGSHPGDPMHPRWSPDGSWILAAVDGQLVLVAPDGTKVRKVGPRQSPTDWLEPDFTWSPDGRSIAVGPFFTTVESGHGFSLVDPRLVVIDAGTGTWRELPREDLPIDADVPVVAWQPVTP